MNIQGGPTTTLSIDTGGLAGEGNNQMNIHGSEVADTEIHVDGMDSNLVAFEGAPQGTPFDTAVQEYVYDYSGNSAEVETGGVRLNMIPKEGSNTLSGGFYRQRWRTRAGWPTISTKISSTSASWVVRTAGSRWTSLGQCRRRSVGPIVRGQPLVLHDVTRSGVAHFSRPTCSRIRTRLACCTCQTISSTGAGSVRSL